MDIFSDDDGPAKKGRKVARANRRRSTIRVFQRIKAAKKKVSANEDNGSTAASLDDENTQTNLPYALIYLAMDRYGALPSLAATPPPPLPCALRINDVAQVKARPYATSSAR
jgi:hypothetical protein